MKALLADALNGLRHRRLAALVALGGLTVSLAACLLVALLALALAAVDPAIPDPGQVVMLDFKGNPPGQPSPWFTASPVSFGTMLKQRDVPLDLISRTGNDGMDVTIGDRREPVFPLLADPDIVPLLNLKVLAGDLRATLASRSGVAATPHLVRRLWGDVPLLQAMGRTLDVRGTLYTVTALIPEIDPRSPLYARGVVGPHDVMAGFDSLANSRTEAERRALYLVNGRVFARLRPGASADQVSRWMREAFMASPLYPELPVEWRSGREAAYFRGLPLTRLPFEGEGRERAWQLLAALAAACSLLLLLAAFNQMNLQAASLLQRQRETALRRSLGADGPALLRLWAVESGLPLLASGALALLAAWWLAPPVADWLRLPPTLPVADPVPLAALLGLAGLTALLLPLTLAVPAWLALRRAPAPALQGRTAGEGPWGRRVRQGLLAVQLGGALVLLSMAGVLAAQQRYLLQADRGFQLQNRVWLGLMVDPGRVPDLHAFTTALQHHPAILHWAYSDLRPARDVEGGERDVQVSATGQQQLLRVDTVSPAFFETWGMTVLAGRPDLRHGEQAMVIDARAARALGFSTPEAAIGAQLRGGGQFMQPGDQLRRVVAVVKDVQLQSAREAGLPQGFLLSDKPQWDLSIHGTDPVALHDAVEQLWAEFGPKVQHRLETAQEQRGEVYQQEAQFGGMLAVLALLSVGVAMCGAYALVADTLRRRRTELVLHRLHGAGPAAITRRVAAEFAPPLLVAMALGLPLAALLGRQYLQGFVDRSGTGAGLLAPLAAAGVITVLVTALAAWRHLRLALALRPIEALQ